MAISWWKKNGLNEWGEFSDDDFSDSDEDEEDDFTNKPYFEYAEQSNTMHGLPRMPQIFYQKCFTVIQVFTNYSML